MRHIAKTELRQIGNVRRIQFRDSIVADVERFEIAQIFELIFFQGRHTVAVKIEWFQLAQRLHKLHRNVGHISIGDVQSF